MSKYCSQDKCPYGMPEPHWQDCSSGQCDYWIEPKAEPQMPLMKSFEFGKSIETCECGVCKRVRAQRDADQLWHNEQKAAIAFEEGYLKGKNEN